MQSIPRQDLPSTLPPSPPSETRGVPFGALFAALGDSVAAFEGAVGAQEEASPHRALERRRLQGDVHPVGPTGKDGRPTAFDVLGWETGFQVLKDTETFSSDIYNASIGWSLGYTLLMMGGPEHARHRALLRGMFNRGAVEGYQAQIFRPVADALIDAFPKGGSVDLIQAFTYELPARSLTRIMGFPQEDDAWVHSRAMDLLGVSFDPDRGMAASFELARYFRPLLRQAAGPETGDILSFLRGARAKGDIDEEGAIGLLRLFLAAGTETTFRSLSNLLFILLSHPEHLEALRADPGLIPGAVQEALRWEPADFELQRMATRDTTLAGVEIPKGAIVTISRLSANRDGRIYPDPHRFDPRRPPKLNLAFAAGPHYCIGAGIARVEMAVALEALLSRLPDLRLDPAWADPRILGHRFRRPQALPIRYTPQGETRHVA